MRRAVRLRRLNSVLGSRCRTLFTTGILPAAAWVAEVDGLNKSELAQLWSMQAAALRPKGRGRSREILFAVHKDKTWTKAFAPVLRWAHEVWQAALGALGCASA